MALLTGRVWRNAGSFQMDFHINKKSTAIQVLKAVTVSKVTELVSNKS